MFLSFDILIIAGVKGEKVARKATFHFFSKKLKKGWIVYATTHPSKG